MTDTPSSQSLRPSSWIGGSVVAGIVVISSWCTYVAMRNDRFVKEEVSPAVSAAIAARNDGIGMDDSRSNVRARTYHRLATGEELRVTSANSGTEGTRFTLQVRIPPHMQRQLEGIVKPEAFQLEMRSDDPNFDPGKADFGDLVAAVRSSATRAGSRR